MNNSNGVQINGAFQEGTSNTRLATSDSNANLNNQSKGAIPKTKSSTLVPKKSTKINNNVEELVVESDSSSELQLNGFTNSAHRKSNFLDDYGSNKCESCSVDKCNISNTSHDIFNSFRRDENLCTKTSEKITSFQPIPCSSRDIDPDFQRNLDTDNSSSSEDNELLSISDDGCIYTYKGDHVADLPSSFFNLEIPPLNPVPEPQNREENASPEMDYLEMDFDPGPSGDGDSDSQSNADLENAENLPQDLGINDCESLKSHSTINNDSRLNDFTARIGLMNNGVSQQYLGNSSLYRAPCLPSASGLNLSNFSNTKQISATASVMQRLQRLKMPWSCSVSQRTVGSSSIRFSFRHHTSNGELSLSNEKLLLNDFYTAKECQDRGRSTLKNVIKTFLLWSEEEANRKQVVQIGASACGATAVLNVLKALRFPTPTIEKVKEAVHTNLRANSSPLTDYLLSRSVAGSTHNDLINGLEILTENKVYSRFFSMYPERVVNLNLWLYFWMSHGAVPLATLNLQKCYGSIPDAWHHQMIYGVSYGGVYLTNPLECVKSSYLWPQLCSESVLLIKRDDVLSRWNVRTDFKKLMKIEDPEWNSLNVVGQIANMIRENRREQRLNFTQTSHIKIPAAYSSGITLVIKKDNPYYPLLLCCPELPLLPFHDEAASCSNGETP